MMRQLVAECRNGQGFVRDRLGALCVCIAFAADFAFPVFSRAGFLAGCSICSVLHERMLLSRHDKGFLADVSAVAGEMIGAAAVAGAGFVCLCRCRLVHILVDRRDADCRFFFLIFAVIILLNQRCEIAFCNCFILSVQSCCFDLDVMYLVREVQLAGVFRLNQRTELILLIIVACLDFRNLDNRTIRVKHFALFRIECGIVAVKCQRSGAVQADITGMTVQIVLCVARQCQVAVSGDRQILFRKNRNGKQVIQGICDPVVTDQIQRQGILGGDRRRNRNRCTHEILGICICAEIVQGKVFQRQCLGIGIVMPAVLLQIAEVCVCHKIMSEHDAVILLCRAEVLGIDLAVRAVLVIERVFGVRIQVSEIIADQIMPAVRGDMDAAHRIAVRHSDEAVSGIDACMDFKIIRCHGLGIVGFAVLKAVFADSLSVCIIESDKEHAVRIGNDLIGADLEIDLADFPAVRILHNDLCSSVILNRRRFRFGNIRGCRVNLFDFDIAAVLILRISVAVLIVFHHVSQTDSVAGLNGVNRGEDSFVKICCHVIFPAIFKLNTG